MQKVYRCWEKRAFVVLCYLMPGAPRCKAQLRAGSGRSRTRHTKPPAAAVTRQNCEAAGANQSAWGIRMTRLQVRSPKQSRGIPQGTNLSPKNPALRREGIIWNTQMNYFTPEDQDRLLALLPALTSRHGRLA